MKLKREVTRCTAFLLMTVMLSSFITPFSITSYADETPTVKMELILNGSGDAVDDGIKNGEKTSISGMWEDGGENVTDKAPAIIFDVYRKDGDEYKQEFSSANFTANKIQLILFPAYNEGVVRVGGDESSEFIALFVESALAGHFILGVYKINAAQVENLGSEFIIQAPPCHNKLTQWNDTEYDFNGTLAKVSASWNTENIPHVISTIPMNMSVGYYDKQLLFLSYFKSNLKFELKQDDKGSNLAIKNISFTNGDVTVKNGVVTSTSGKKTVNLSDYKFMPLLTNISAINTSFWNTVNTGSLNFSDLSNDSSIRKAIVDGITKWSQENTEMFKEEAENAGTQGGSSDEVEESAKATGSSYSIWSYLILDYFKTGNSAATYFAKRNIDRALGDGNTFESDEDKAYLSLFDYGYGWIKDDTGQKLPTSYTGAKIGAVDEDTFGLVSLDEDLRLRIYYAILTNYMDTSIMTDEQRASFESKKEKLDAIFDMKLAVGDSTGYSSDDPLRIQSENNAPNEYLTRGKGVFEGDLRSNANSAVDVFDAQGVNTPSVKTAARNFEAIAKYYAYGVVDSSANYTQSDVASLNKLNYSEAIEKVVPAFSWELKPQGVNSETNVNYDVVSLRSAELPVIPNVNSVVNSYQAHNLYGRLYLSLMYVKRYAQVKITGSKDLSKGPDTVVYAEGATSAYSGLKFIGTPNTTASQATSTDFANEALDEFLTKNESEDDKSKVQVPDDIARFIRTYMQIHDGCEYLGINSTNADIWKWVGPEIQRICEYYDSIEPYKNVLPVTAGEEGDGETQAFNTIFNDEDQSFSAAYAKGVGASATFSPLVTNTYDPEAWAIVEDYDQWINDFHYKYGFLRKALYRDTTANAAVQNYISGNIGPLEVVTLRDLLENKGEDVVLYIDSKMYRVDEIAEKQNLAYSRLQNTAQSGNNDEGIVDSLSHTFSTWLNTDAESICKTGTAKVYSQQVANKVDALGQNKKGWDWLDYNHYVMTDEDIHLNLTGAESDEDTVTKAFAVVSGIYRDKSVFNIAQNQSASPSPVFVSSKNLSNVVSATQEDFNTLYNYFMVINLKNRLGMNVDLENDLDVPLFMDVYGNICTMSGLVVIPASSNATLYNATEYDPATGGFASLYNEIDATKIAIGSNRNEKMLDKVFVMNKNSEMYDMGSKTYNGTAQVSFVNLPLSSVAVKEALYNIAYAKALSNDSQASGIAGAKFNRRVNLILEVLRGAPVEAINLQKEGLTGKVGVDKTGIYIAYRIEQLGSLLLSNSNGNSILQMPNLAFMPGMEYVATVLFKVMFAIMFVVLMIQVYIDGVSGILGIRTIGKFILTIASVIIAIFVLPALINFSYYHTNKTLLQSEATYMQMLTTEKKLQGQEISIRARENGVQSTTKFYLKLEDISVPWFSVATDVLSSDTFTRMQDIYNDAMKGSAYRYFGGSTDVQEDSLVVVKGSSLYADVDRVLETSDIRFKPYENSTGGSSFAQDKTAGFLYQNVENADMSYLIPYYAILDSILYDIQTYNETNKVMGYTGVQAGTGDTVTRGLIKPYFTSHEFMEGNVDLLGLFRVYNETSSKDAGSIFLEDELMLMRRSLWCNIDGLSDEQIRDNLYALDLKARQFVADNRGMLDKVSDSTFLKCMALYLATEHNTMFKVPTCRGLEIYQLDTRDIMRLSLDNKSAVMKGAQKTFEKFCFDQGGTFAIILAGFLEVIYWITSVVKPAVMIVLIGALIFAYIYRKLLRLEGNHSLEGYLVSVALLCFTNMVYALMLKLSMTIPNHGSSIIVNLIGQMILQISYSMLLFFVGYTVLSNLHDVGFYAYKTIYDTHVANKVDAVSMSVNRIMSKSILAPIMPTPRRGRRSDYTRTDGLTGGNMLTRMREREERRRENVYSNRR